MSATVVGADGAQNVRVRDLTSSGAGISCDRPLEPGSDVLFKRGRMLVAARVAWANRAFAGLEFYRLISVEELAATLPPDFAAASAPARTASRR